MEQGKRYLLLNSKSLLEWECLEVSEYGYKVKNLISDNSFFSNNRINDPFWVLKTDVSEKLETKYKLLF